MKTSFSLSGMAFITFIVFLILKLTSVIDWHWALVCIPLYVIGGIWILAGIFYLIMFIIAWKLS